MQPSPRKPATRAGTIRTASLPVPAVRRKIWEAACDLLARQDCRLIHKALANRFQISECAVSRSLVIQGMKHERAAAALQHGVMTALALAREAERSVEEDAA